MLKEENLEITYSGYPWWLEHHASNIKETKSIKFKFTGIQSGSLNLTDFENGGWEKDLECLALSEVQNDRLVEIHCNSRIGEPERFYKLYLDVQMQYSFVPDFSELFNCGNEGSIAGFQKVVGSSSFLLYEGGVAISNAIINELKRQGVDYSAQTTEGSDILLEVQINGSRFFCENAVAEFSD